MRGRRGHFKARDKRGRATGSSPPSPERLGGILRRCGITLPPHQLQQLWAFHNLLRKRNQDQELTRLIGFETIAVKHYADCLIVGDLVKIPSPVVDVGTGAGFPGIPLKIRYPGLALTLAEPRPKRVAFLQEAVRELRLKNVAIFDHKVVSRSFRKPVKAVITRAVETMDKTILRTSGCLEKGGWILFMKGPGVDPELEEAQRRFGDRYRLALDKAYQIPHTPHRRRLIVLERLDEPTAEPENEGGEEPSPPTPEV